VIVAFASQFPDLIDKPLAWYLGVLPGGRTLAHSLFAAAAAGAVVLWIGRRWQREEAAFAFILGYITHVVSDIEPRLLVGVLQGDFTQLQWGGYLLWPLYPPPPYPNDGSFAVVFASFEFDPYTIFQFVLFGFATVVWIATGAAGLAELRRHVRRQLGRSV